MTPPPDPHDAADDWFDDDEEDAGDARQTTCQLCGDWPPDGVGRHEIGAVDFAPGRAISPVWWLCSICLGCAQEGDAAALVGRSRVDGLDEESTERIAEILADALRDPDA